MERADSTAAVRGTWILANPWFWTACGFGAVTVAWSLVHVFDADGGVLRFFLIGVSLLFCGVALTLRLRSQQAAHLNRLGQPQRAVLLLVLGGLHAVLALLVTLAVLLGWLGVEWIVMRPGQLVILWFVMVPMSATAASVCLSRSSRRAELTRGEEASALLTATAVVCFIAGLAVYRAETFRLLFGAMTLVSVVAAPLVVVPQSMRRAVISGLILLHFGGICTAALSAPPAPWVVSQLWVRIYRPYLEFMYLNNAYHFYAPEPGPASYIWFRLIYDDPSTKETLYHWVKLPEIDEDGSSRHRLALEYQRILSLTENAIQGNPVTTFYRGAEPLPFFKRRLEAVAGPARAGIPQPEFTAPFHPGMAIEHQYIVPTSGVRHILSSFARHVGRTPHPDRPDAKIRSIKIYKVTHLLPWPPNLYLVQKLDVREPDFYRHSFMGEYDPSGQLKDDEDPFLYWVLPNVREYYPATSATDYRVKSYARRHAGDPEWIYLPREKRWVAGR